jgi:hypothetical protein
MHVMLLEKSCIPKHLGACNFSYNVWNMYTLGQMQANMNMHACNYNKYNQE